MDNWRNRPLSIDDWPPDVDYIIFLDENGNSNMKGIAKYLFQERPANNGDMYFCITGCIIKKEDFKSIETNIMNLKMKYWEDGKYPYNNESIKRVCFHSREIRKHEGPFSNEIIEYNSFIDDLSSFMQIIPITIISSAINKWEHFLKYYSPIDPYDLCLVFILERFSKYILPPNNSGAIILEARGKKEDKKLLKHIINVLDNGTDYVTNKCFQNINGVYFNPKWSIASNGEMSYFGLEIADLCSYPIYKFISRNKKDRDFMCIEDKIYGYPNYTGYGIKTFPIK